MLRLAHRLEQKPATLSGGEQQRVALGRSLIRTPEDSAARRAAHQSRRQAAARHARGAQAAASPVRHDDRLRDARRTRGPVDGRGDRRPARRPRRAAGHAGRSLRTAGRPLCREQDRLAAYEHLRRQSGRRRPRASRRPTAASGRPPARRAARRGRTARRSASGPSDIRLAGRRHPPSSEPIVQQLEPLGRHHRSSRFWLDNQPLRMVLPESQAVGIKDGDKLPIIIDPAKISPVPRS